MMIFAIGSEPAKNENKIPFSLDAAEKNAKLTCIAFCTSTKLDYMKHKFFFLLVTACAALFSFSGLTGCSGGNDDKNYEEAAGYLTLDGFSKRLHGIRLESGAAYIYIKPLMKDDTIYAPEASNVRVMFAEIYNEGGTVSTRALVKYEIIRYAQAGAIDTENGLPELGRMTLTLGQASEAEDRELLTAIGLGVTSDTDACLNSSLAMDLLFTGNGGTVTYGVMGSTGGFLLDETRNVLNVWGNFSVIK